METPEIMQAFLIWLGGDPLTGARKYEEIRRRLMVLFRYRGCDVPEELADDTIDRSARAVSKPDFQYRGDPLPYIRGVARNVFREWLRRKRRFPTESIPEGGLDVPAPEPLISSDDTPHPCLGLCLKRLPPARKTLLIRYYQSEKRAKIDGRRVLAKELGIGLNALRIQVFRLRNSLRQCMEQCKAKRETERSFES